MQVQTDSIHYTPFNPLNSRPVNTPIFQTNSFEFENFKQIEDTFSLKKRNFVYSRGGNPTVNLLETRLGRLENGKGAVCFSSGMGAISSTLLSFLESGDRVLMSNIVYGSSVNLTKSICPKFGISVTYVDFTNITELQKKIQSHKDIKVVFFETPCNPTLELIDIGEVVRLCRKKNIKVVIDNTFASPILQNPLNLGVDVVIHSLSKFINGHGDALGGVAISQDQKFLDELKFKYLCLFGSVIDPHSAFLHLRGLKTLNIRMKQHVENAKRIAAFLEKHPKISQVVYPGSKSFSGNNIFKKQMTEGGAIVTLYLKEKSVRKIQKFITSLKIFKLAVSYGDTVSLAEYPLFMTHREYLHDKRSKSYKQLQNLIRLSIGLEDSEDLIKDLKQALNRI